MAFVQVYQGSDGLDCIDEKYLDGLNVFHYYLHLRLILYVVYSTRKCNFAAVKRGKLR